MEQEENSSEGYEYENYDYITKTKPLGRLIFLVAFTAIMLISSTYAWFSTQKNVTISGLKGEVKVVEGLQMSLDAKHWINTINFEHFNQPTDGSGWTVKADSPTAYLDTGATFQEPAEGVTNIVPTDYKPVSTTGRTNEGIGKTSLTMYNGEYTETEGLKDIGVASEESSSGYYAFDLFLLNTSAEDKTTDVLKIVANQYQKVRVYVWIEGQDPDCINYASLGQGLELTLGITKGDDANTDVGANTEPGPYLPTGFSWANADHTEIKDSSNNQYVWVSVPRDATVYNDLDDDAEDTGMSDTTNEDILAFDVNNLTTANLEAIETELKEYTATYRESGYTDEFYSTDQHGFADADAYDAHKDKMLASVFKNGGFYVGKYETGIADDDPDPDVVEARTQDDADEGTITQTPVIQANAYPYNYVTNKQAQELATGMESGEYTSSLMFGLQWDLVLKHLEMETDLEVADLKSNSTEWGNYYNHGWTIANEDAKYSDDYGESWNDGVDMTNLGEILLSTGASDEFEKGGIYDFAGNVFEWTLEYTSDADIPCASRGGYCFGYGVNFPASSRDTDGTTGAGESVGFRVALF